jgi:hypothetical protein
MSTRQITAVIMMPLLMVLSSGCHSNREIKLNPTRLERLAYETAMRQLVADLSNNYPMTDENLKVG